jgi:DNA-binding GntR family transcriptional regulator
MEQTRAETPVRTDGEAARSAQGAGRVPAARRRLPERHSVRGQVLTALRDALLAGDLVPGRVYSAPALADRYGVSPTPVREAMQRLASEGLVETVPNRGFRVTEHTAQEAAELAEVRVLLEVPTVLRLGRALPPGSWEGLRSLADATVGAASRGDGAGYAEADRAFHRALLELSGNARLVAVAEDVHRRARYPVAALRPSVPELVAAATEHAALLDALQRRDLAGAERILHGHLTSLL